MVGTLGPGNLLLVTSGAQHGLQRPLPFLLGLFSGKFLINVAVAFGFGSVLTQNQQATTPLRGFSQDDFSEISV